jgi:hypothetical protein
LIVSLVPLARPRGLQSDGDCAIGHAFWPPSLLSWKRTRNFGSRLDLDTLGTSMNNNKKKRTSSHHSIMWEDESNDYFQILNRSLSMVMHHSRSDL